MDKERYVEASRRQAQATLSVLLPFNHENYFSKIQKKILRLKVLKSATNVLKFLFPRQYFCFFLVMDSKFVIVSWFLILGGVELMSGGGESADTATTAVIIT